MTGSPGSGRRKLLLRSVPLPVAALVAHYGSAAMTDPGTSRVVVMLVLFFATGLATGYVVDAVVGDHDH